MNLFNIQADLTSLDSFVSGLYKRFGEENLSNLTIFLPSRRSCRLLQDILLRKSNKKALLLPMMQPLGEIDEEAFLSEKIIDNKNLLSNKTPISFLKQKLILAKLIHQNSISITHNLSSALFLAEELGKLLADLSKEEIPLEKLEEVEVGEHATHWQEILSILNIIIRQWPDLLNDRGLIDQITYRKNILQSISKSWQNSPPKNPVIIYGSTGSIVSTREFMKNVLSFKNGYVILPSLDPHIDDDTWKTLGDTHNQYYLKNLLKYLGADRKNVSHWYGNSEISDSLKITSEIMRPESTCHKWEELDSNISASHISYIEAADLHQEAKVISMILRSSIEQKDFKAALITNERDLATRVKIYLQRWNINIDDSVGSNLSETPQIIFLKLLADMVLQDFAPIPMLSALKHHFTDKEKMGKFVSKFELAIIRGPRLASGINKIISALKKLGEDELVKWAKTIEEKSANFIAMAKMPEVSFKDLLSEHLRFAESISSGPEQLWGDESGEEVFEFMNQILESSEELGNIDPKDYSKTLSGLLYNEKFRSKYNKHPNLHILSPIESRLCDYDLVILGSANEGSWPTLASPDPWLNRAMRKSIGLPPKDRRIGQSAHDFYTHLNAKQVYITRSKKIDGTPTTESRWIQRLKVVLKKINRLEDLNPEYPWLDWSNQLDQTDHIQKIEPPEPRPPLELRPRKLAVTAIEKLIRDPYSVYAQKILKLRPLKPIDQEPGAAEFGNFIHESLDLYAKSKEKSYKVLLNCGKTILKRDLSRPAILNLWWPRFERIAKWFVENDKTSNMVFTEISGKLTFNSRGGPFTLTAKADRIEIDSENNITIIDYKTGILPTETSVKQGFSPQLPLEGLIAITNGFKDLEKQVAHSLAKLSYIHLTGGENIGIIKDLKLGETTEETNHMPELIFDNKNKLYELIDRFDQESTPYKFCPNKGLAPKYNDYKHLARVDEWES